jgi:glyoxylase I family protein
MKHVIGIGGLFFRARDPVALAQWYKDNLGIDLAPADYGQIPWSQEAGPTVFAPFPEDSEYFGNASKNWMINFRVRDLAGLVELLRASKIDVSVDPQSYPNGRFARLHDSEGNPIELWEPK